MRKFTGVPVCNRDADWRADAVCTEEGLKREGVQRFEDKFMGEEDDVKKSGCCWGGSQWLCSRWHLRQRCRGRV